MTTTPLEEETEKDNPEEHEGSEGSTAKRAESTNNMPAEKMIKWRIQMNMMLRMSRTSWILMLIAHRKK